MEEEREVEEKGREIIADVLRPPSPSPRSPLPPGKRILSAPVEPSPPHSTKKTRDRPNFSNCHRCGARRPAKGARDRLRFLPSNWRIALLCKDCLTAITSAEACSYCFSKISGADQEGFFDCCKCRRRVHCRCVPEHHCYTPPQGFNRDSFACIDCCPYVKPRGGTGSNVLSKDVGRDAITAPEKKAAAAARMKQKVLRKAVAPAHEAQQATKEKVLRKDVVLVHEAKQARDGTDVVFAAKEMATKVDEAVPDEKLALQLHRAMNGSQRISRSLGSWNSDHSANLKKMQESDSYGICGKVGVSSVDRSFFEEMERLQSGLDSHLDVAGREDQGSYSRKAKNSVGDEHGIGSTSVSTWRSDKLPNEWNKPLPLKHCKESAGDDFYGSQQTESHDALNRYSMKYSRNTWRLKGVVDMECQTVPCRQISSSEVSKSCLDAPCKPHKVVMHPYTSTSGSSGCQS